MPFPRGWVLFFVPNHGQGEEEGSREKLKARKKGLEIRK